MEDIDKRHHYLGETRSVLRQDQLLNMITTMA